MAGVTHLGIGLAAKRIAPNVPAPVLVAAAYGIDIIWGGFFAAGIEKYGGVGVDSVAPWSHGLLMSVIWSAAAALITLLITRNQRTSLIIGLLMFSHWIVDFIAKPMTHAFPGDAGVTLLFDKTRSVGLGVWGTAAGEYIGEYVPVALGLAIYIMTVVQRRRTLRAAKEGQAA